MAIQAVNSRQNQGPRGRQGRWRADVWETGIDVRQRNSSPTNKLGGTYDMARPKPHTQLHKDGSLWAKGQTLNGVATGYWEWFRIDGTKMRSGHFEDGEQIGEWITYDKAGKAYKVTQFKAKSQNQPSTKSAA